MFTITRQCAVDKNCVARPKIKVTFQGQMWETDCPVHNSFIRYNLTKMLTIKRQSAVSKNCVARTKWKVTVQGQLW